VIKPHILFVKKILEGSEGRMNETAGETPREGAALAPRRDPVQKRSRERMQRILDAATGLIAREGSDALRMGDVAEKAGISIGSLYQYFPEKGAIIRALAERYGAESRACIEEGLAGVQDLQGLGRAFGQLVDTYYGIFLAEPVMRDIWSGMQADKALSAMELADSRANGELLSRLLLALRPGEDPEAIKASAFLVWQLGEATMRLAVSVERREGDAIVAAYKRMAIRELVG
jgi:AcrR family transcriptional regulator